MTGKPTPTPWETKISANGLAVWLIGDDGRQIASSSWHNDSDFFPTKEVTAENFAFIVKACNCHDELVAALKRTLSWLTSYPGGAAAAGPYEQAKAALTKAGETL